jgi:competence ComEA-like helix-hairpin-helix protein
MEGKRETRRDTRRDKACLLVSLIILVWNVGATGRRFLFGNPAHPILAPEFTRSESTSAPPESPMPATDCAANAPAGKLTAKQRYLMGKRVDINKASADEIGELPGISDPVARAVVETRKRLGGFRRARDLLQVRGIKEKRLKIILPFLVKFSNN